MKDDTILVFSYQNYSIYYFMDLQVTYPEVQNVLSTVLR